jgi:hypothetical protein
MSAIGRVHGVRLCRAWLAVAACAAGLLVAACGGPASPAVPTKAGAALATPSAWPTAAPGDPVDLVTYEPDSACASVQTTTSIDKVPAACAAAWKRFAVRVVPGQDAIKRTPHFPSVLAPHGVSSTIAERLAVAFWRTETFQAFALGTRQLGITDGLGPSYIFRVIGVEERAVEHGATVTTPLCHFFPTQIRIVPLMRDFARYVHRPDRFLGVEATFTGPCYGTATDAKGNTTELFRFNGQRSAVYVGDIGRGDPEGPVLTVTSIGECDQPEVKATCAQ